MNGREQGSKNREGSVKVREAHNLLIASGLMFLRHDIRKVSLTVCLQHPFHRHKLISDLYS